MAKPHPRRIGIVVGETSGDLLGSELVKSLKAIYPDAEFAGIAGPDMQALGVQSWYPMEQLSVIGIWAILKRLPSLLKLRKDLAQQFIDWQADMVIGIDAPEFNLGLEKRLAGQGILRVHYVSPSVWAWRKKRIFTIKDAVDLMLTLFPFEKAIYQEHNIPVACVGHPLADLLPIENDTQAARAKLGIEPDAKVLAVLPGSRGSEIKYLGELFLRVAQKLKQSDEKLQILLPYPNETRKTQIQALIDAEFSDLPVQIIERQSRDVMSAADAVLLASGTATLEALLLKKPMTVAYKVSPLSYAIYSRLVTIDYFALPNLLLQGAPVPEFMQDEATVENLVASVSRQLSDGLSPELSDAYVKLHESMRLGGGLAAAEAIRDHWEQTC